MKKNLREFIKLKLEESDVPVSTIATKAGVPYGALYHFKTKGSDMRSEHIENLYAYFTGKELFTDES